MSCHGCAEKYGFMKKEYGCPKCGFSYCKKCLRFQISDPKSKKQLQVCSKCHHAVSAAKEPIAVINAMQRLESMDDPAKPPIIVYKQSVRKGGLQELKKGLSMEDQQLLERLESLKKDEDTGPSKRQSSEKVEEEIAERLARLKGEEYRPEAKNQSVLLKNFKPETEQDVIAKYAAEVEMNSRYESSVTSDIEERLARLRGDNPSGTNPPSTSSKITPDLDELDELTEEEQVKLIMEKFQDELALEKRIGMTGTDMEIDESKRPEDVEILNSDSDEDIDVDELCGICSEKRATLICEDCDDDIYCKGCYQELHRDLGEVHAPKAFKKK